MINSTINERIKELRLALNMSGEKFGARIGISRSAVSKIEKGIVNVTEQMQKSICREFTVNEEWLRTGTGEMFYTMSQDEEIAYLLGQALPNADGKMKEVLIAFGRLSQKFTSAEWDIIWKFLKTLTENEE